MLFFICVISLSNSVENLSRILIGFALNLLSSINIFLFDYVEAVDFIFILFQSIAIYPVKEQCPTYTRCCMNSSGI